MADTDDEINALDDQEQVELQAIRDKYHALRLIARIFRQFFASIGGG